MISANQRSRHVHYGSHTVGPATWLNFDSSPTLRLQRLPLIGSAIQRRLPDHHPIFPETVGYGDIVRGLPIAEKQCRAIYCSHVLEHLSREDCRTALQNTFRYLEPGGLFRFVMPDLRGLAEAYLSDPNPAAAHQFMERTWLGRITRPTSLSQRLVASVGNSAHLWMWDYASMKAELEDIGFVNIRRATYADSAESAFDDVEDSTRWEEPGFGTAETIACLGIECTRPVR